MSQSSRWAHQWPVTGSTGNAYTVSQDYEGNWACSCRGWIMHTPRKDCKHIREVQGRPAVQALLNTQPTPPPAQPLRPTTTVAPVETDIYYSDVQTTTPTYANGQLLTVDIPMPRDEHMQWTAAYDLLELGLPWEQIQPLFECCRGYGSSAVIVRIQCCGRKIYQAPRNIDPVTTRIVPLAGYPAPDDWSTVWGAH